MSRALGIVSMVLSCGLAACRSGATSDSTGGAGTTAAAGTAGVGAGGTGGSTGSGGGAGGAAGTSGSAGTSGGGAGVAAVDAGEAPRDASGTETPPPKDASAEAAEAGASACPPSAVICDDFEKYAAGATNLSPDWITYAYSGAVRVDATKPRAGKQSLHLTTLAGDHHYADIIRETRGQEVVPLKHYGRLMVWITAIPPSSHWNLNMSSGPMIGAPEEVAKVFEGGMFGKLMSNYAQRGRIMKNGQYVLRAGGPEAGDPGADADCAVAAPTQTIAAGKWVCWEWLFDGTADEAHLWVDGQAMTEVTAIKSGKQCQGPGFMGRPMMPMYRWESPRVWDEIWIGWEQYQNTPAQEVWIDDVVVGTARVGCPAP